MSAPPTGVLFYEARAKPLSTIGLIQPGSYYQFYLTQTTTLTNVYADGALTIPLSQTPVTGGTTAASDGRLVPIYLDPSVTYRYRLYSVFNVLLEDIDPYIPLSSQSQGQIGQTLFPQTSVELAAGVTPTNYYIPSHIAVGYVLPERYGGAGDNSTLNDTAHTNAMKVAGSMGDGVVVYSDGTAGIWKFQNPVTIGAAGQGRRVIGVGRPEWNFNASISSTLDIVTISCNLFTLYTDQPQFENIQVQCNSGGRDGVVLTVGNRPLIRNIRVVNSGRDGYVESVTAPNWIEKADVSVLVRTAGRNGIRQEILGAGGTNPYINEGTYFLEVRGVSVITAGGAALKFTGSSGLGGAAKLSDNRYRTIFDAIYNTSAPVPSTSTCVLDTVTVQNCTFDMPAWENTGSGGNPGAGPLIKVLSGNWGGLNVVFPNWNSLWGNGTVDAAITQVNRLDFSFPQSTLVGPLNITTAADNTAVATFNGQTTTGSQADITINRTGSANSAVGHGSNITLANTTGSTSFALQEFNGDILLYTFQGGSWGIRARVTSSSGIGGIKINELSTLWSVSGGAPSGSLGANGDYALRQDTPGTANQRFYVKSAGAWTGIL